MKEVDCGQQRTAIAMAVLFGLGVLGLLGIVALVVADLLGDSKL